MPIAILKKISDELSKIGGPLIFSGDLNISYRSDAIKVLDTLELRNHSKENGLTTTLSSLSRVPVDVPCDYIYSSHHIQTNEFSISEDVVSDHKALIFEFDI